MNGRNEPREDAYDVVVIGSGMGGITAGALLAKVGRKVLVVEQQAGAGGYAHAFQRGPYTFDPAIHVVAQGQDGAIFDALLRYLDVRDLVHLHRAGRWYAAVFPDLTFDAPVGIGPFIDAVVAAFPRSEAEIRSYFDVCTRLHQELHEISLELSLKEIDEVMRRCPTIFKYGRTTVGAVLEEYVSDPQIRAVCAAAWPYLGVPPSKLDFVTFSVMLLAHVEELFHCEGGFQRMVDALVTALERQGGELVLKNGARKILLEDGRVIGLELEGGQQIRAPVVVSNADARHTFDELVGNEQLPEQFVKRLHRMKPSLPAFLVFAATTLDVRQLNAAHDTFLYKHWDHEETYTDILNCVPGGISIRLTTLEDSSLAPEGEHLAVVTAPMVYDIGKPWQEEKDRYTQMLLDDVDRVFPGFRDKLTFAEASTPLAMERYTRNYQGASYGWELSPPYSGSRRLKHETPIEGLILSGHWTQPGTGCVRTLGSGVHAAQIVLKNTGGDPRATFDHPDLPPAI
jgi:prolycopene isomerase